MSRTSRSFVCTSCGAVQVRWHGKCPDCGEWNALEERLIERVADDPHRPAVGGEPPAAVQRLHEISSDAVARWSTGLGEFDRVLGGGLVPGSAVLIGGDPGIGKSTLALQASQAMARGGRNVLYCTSEESPGQVRLRAERLAAAGASPAAPPQGAPRSGDLLVAAQANLDVILNQVRQHRPAIVIVDSIQMVYRPDLPSVPGSVTQLRDCAARLIWLAKQMGFALVLVGHVTKEGAIAGPKVLEHIVDCVVYFEGERFHSHRLLRTAKNRYGSTDELGIFDMTDAGLRPVEDPAAVFLERLDAARPGSVILAACEGTRVLLVEVQALCAQSVFGSAKRKTTGVDPNRVAMILAVLEKHAGFVVGDQDVFVNLVGGMRVAEPAADLAIALAIAGTLSGRSLPRGTAVFGELGLGGEVRPVTHTRRRVAEAQRIGLSQVVLPAREGDQRRGRDQGDERVTPWSCATLADAIRHLG